MPGMTNKKILRTWALGLCLFGSQSRAALSPVAISIIPPVQFPSEDVTVTGPRISLLWGDHRNAYVADIGLIGNMTSLNFGGFAVSGVFNYNAGVSTILGFQVAGIVNINKNVTTVVGVQFAGLVNYNTAASSVVGLQIAAAANMSPFTNIWGAQIGIYNSARVINGLQIGLVNVAEFVRGLQIGLINIHRQGLFVISPLINVGF